MSKDCLARAPLGGLEVYGVSATNGFLPSEPPLARLSKQYDEWEAICSNLASLIQDKTLLAAVSQFPTLSTEWLCSEPEWRRAYVILGFLAAGVLWGSGRTVDRLPANISVPLTVTAAHLGLPPCPTLAGQNLWNYKLLDPDRSILDPENLEAQFTFTGVDDESWFFVVLVAIEARGGSIITLLLEAFEKAAMNDTKALTDYLQQVATHIRGLGELLPRMYERCNPHFFYNHIRPFLAGSKPTDTLPDGVFYEDGKGGGAYYQYSGPTAAQSSLLQFIDVALGVRHRATDARPGSYGLLSKKAASGEKPEELLGEMRQYMPLGHRLFLQHVADIASIRQYIIFHTEDVYLQAAYNQCLEALVAFRNTHLQIVSRYIILPGRTTQRDTTVMFERLGDTGGQSTTVNTTRQKPQGTGGSEPVKFLKQVRDETKDTLVQDEK